MGKWIYRFGDGGAEGRGDMDEHLGAKGAGLAEMSRLGLPVPPGFTITTEACAAYYAQDLSFPEGLESESAMGHIEALTGSRFGDGDDPLLVSVRSGARASMPGMMDTILNLGLNDDTVNGLARQSGDRRFAYDCYRRFIQMFSDVVLGVAHHHFEDLLEHHKGERGLTLDTDLKAEDWLTLVAGFKARVAELSGVPFPTDAREQLRGAIGAVFGSWMNTRAQTFRKLHGIPEAWGTAVNVQAMVYGNMGGDCCTGVAFSRNPSTGEKKIYGEYLIDAQGEDVVAGIRTPRPLTAATRQANGADEAAMEEAMPKVYAALLDAVGRLESHFGDMQDIEFTVQQGKLFLLQTRTGRRSAGASIRIAIEMANEKLIDRADAVRAVDPLALEQLLHPKLDPEAPRTLLARGLPASPGAASGHAVLDSSAAEERAAHGEAVILVRLETSPDDIHGVHAARGVLTCRGGMTSHAAVVARGMGRPCVAGTRRLTIDRKNRRFGALGVTLEEGDLITIDGATGEVFRGAVPTIDPELSPDFRLLLSWADEFGRLAVRANADTPDDARTAKKFGAAGIGLCRAEQMFFDPERIIAVREMILAADGAGRETALAKIMPLQRNDFGTLFRIMGGLPVTIRLLDPPFHEFLPKSLDDLSEIAENTGADLEALRKRANRLYEVNPMLGHRGCRLGITFPEIYDMQVRAIFEAAVDAGKESGEAVIPEIMIPFVLGGHELRILKERIDAVAAEVTGATGVRIDYRVGAMIELPRAALQAGEIAEHAAFLSFGIGALTKMTLGLSRDDAGDFLDSYQQLGILAHNPFVSLDTTGVGELVRIASERGRAARAGLALGICGDHGGDPASIAFCEETALDYVSCAPHRVPIARLAAAQAALATRRKAESS